MGKQKDTKPWTWEQIAALKGKRREAFLETYGDRGKAACVVAKKVLSDQGQMDKLLHVMSCAGWSCHKCPVFWNSPWCGKGRHVQLNCVERSPVVYERMVKELGLLPCREG